MNNDFIHPNDCGCNYSGEPRKIPGCFRVMRPKCENMIAQLATLTVEDISGVKDLADCLVHVSNINTTIYVDAQHKYIVTFAGPVYQEDYDYATNSLNLRSQTCYDFKNNRAIHYDATGAYRLSTLTAGEEE